MIKTIVTPQNADLYIHIPQSYIGKQIEVLLYTTDEVNVPNENLTQKKSLRGALKLSNQQYTDFQQHAKNIRNEWSKDI